MATFGDTNDFPAFYSTDSGCKSPYFVATAEDAASIIKIAKDSELRSGKYLFNILVCEENV